LLIEEIREKPESFLEFNESKNNISETIGHIKGSPKRKVYNHEFMY
jgi:hypothetical protein